MSSKKYEKVKKERCNFMLRPDTMDKLRRYCGMRGIPMSVYIEMLIEKELDNEKHNY